MSPEEKARTLVKLALKDHDEGGYAYAGMNEILENRIAQALRDARADALDEALRIVDSVNSHLTDEEQTEWIVGEIRSLKDKGGA